MSGIAFYLVKALAISTVAIIFAIVLAVFSYGLSKLIPDDPSESVEMSILFILAYVALASCAVWIARTQLKYIPTLFHGMAGFDAERLKEKDSGALGAIMILLFLDPLLDRATRVKKYFNQKLQ